MKKIFVTILALMGVSALCNAQVFEENMGRLNANMTVSDYYEEGGFTNNKQFVFEGDAEVHPGG